jgi:hypothetical protein
VLASLPSNSALAYLLAKGHTSWIDMPLEAYVCQQFGLSNWPDYPIAAIAAQADGLTTGSDYWLRADPVHLMMQRDSMSLIEPIPQLIPKVDAQVLMAALNAHFEDDGLQFLMGRSGAWYCRLMQTPQISTTLPRVALNKNIYTFMPKGEAASEWLSIINQVQMLWFEHKVNVARQSEGQYEVNSVWFSGGGVLPAKQVIPQAPELILSNQVFYQGLAAWAGVSCKAVPLQLSEVLHCQAAKVHVQLDNQFLADDGWFKALVQAMRANKISLLTLNIGFYEKTQVVQVKPLDVFKFWRKPQAVARYFND